MPRKRWSTLEKLDTQRLGKKLTHVDFLRPRDGHALEFTVQSRYYDADLSPGLHELVEVAGVVIPRSVVLVAVHSDAAVEETLRVGQGVGFVVDGEDPVLHSGFPNPKDRVEEMLFEHHRDLFYSVVYHNADGAKRGLDGPGLAKMPDGALVAVVPAKLQDRVALSSRPEHGPRPQLATRQQIALSLRGAMGISRRALFVHPPFGYQVPERRSALAA